MATTVSLRRILDRQQWEIVNQTPNTISALFGVVACASTQFDQFQMWMEAPSAPYLYDPKADAWVLLIGSGMSNFSESAAPGGALTYHPSGPTGTATAGGASTMTTTLTLPGSIEGYTIRITGGTGAGQERIIASNTYGANAVITVSAPWTVTPDNTSTYLILSGRFWAVCGKAATGLRYYDVATNTWSGALSVTGLTSSASEWRLNATPAFGNTVASGTATSGSATTLVNTGKNWTTNQWTNYQVRITAGTGAGKVATITSNTATQLNFASVTTVLDNTSQYVIEPNDDFLYASNSLTVTLFRYSISTNTWTTLSPGVARSPTPAAGSTLHWIGLTSSAVWADETNIKNGRFLYGFNGSGNTLSYYDIALNTWTNLAATAYHRGNSGTTFTGSAHYVADREYIYVFTAPGAAGAATHIYRFDCARQTLDVAGQWLNTAGIQPITAQRIVISSYTDGGTTLRWLYFLAYTGGTAPNPFYRMLLI